MREESAAGSAPADRWMLQLLGAEPRHLDTLVQLSGRSLVGGRVDAGPPHRAPERSASSAGGSSAAPGQWDGTDEPVPSAWWGGSSTTSSVRLTGVADATRDGLPADLRGFVEWAERAVAGPERRRPDAARRYLAYLTTRRYARRTIARRRLGAAPVLRVAPADAASSPTTPPARCTRRAATVGCPRVLKAGELDALLDDAAGAGRRRPGADPPPRRRRARAALRQRPAGRRAVRARPRLDVDVGQRLVVVWGKGSKQRRVPLSRAAAEAVPAGSSAAGRPDGCSGAGARWRAGAGDRVVPEPAGAAAHARDVRRMIDRRAAGADQPPRAAPHLRHPPARRRGRPAGGAGAARSQPTWRRPSCTPMSAGSGCAPCTSGRIRGPDGGACQGRSRCGRDLGRVQGHQRPGAARPAHPPLLAAGEVRRGPHRRGPAGQRRAAPTSSATGIVGLIEAIERFDPERGPTFEGYALGRIRGAILDELRAARLGAEVGPGQGPRHRVGLPGPRGQAAAGADRRRAGRGEPACRSPSCRPRSARSPPAASWPSRSSTALGDVLADRREGPAGMVEEVENARGPGRGHPPPAGAGAHRPGPLLLRGADAGRDRRRPRRHREPGVQIHAKAVIHLRARLAAADRSPDRSRLTGLRSRRRADPVRRTRRPDPRSP